MCKNPLFIVLLSLIGCSSGQTKETAASKGPAGYPAGPLIIEDTTEGWGADLKLSVIGETTTDTSVDYKVNALHENKNIGFELIAPLKRSGKLTLKSTGEASDNFLRLLEKLYKQNPSAAHAFTGAVTVTGIDLGEMARQLGAKNTEDDHPVAKYKVFFQGETESDYAEMYLNINPSEHWVEWKEKDEEYRPVITRLLSKK